MGSQNNVVPSLEKDDIWRSKWHLSLKIIDIKKITDFNVSTRVHPNCLLAQFCTIVSVRVCVPEAHSHEQCLIQNAARTGSHIHPLKLVQYFK